MNCQGDILTAVKLNTKLVQMICGDPQGSIPGPTLRNILYDGLLELPVPDGVTLFQYADDIAAILLGRDAKDLKTRTDAVMLLRNNYWLCKNHLKLAKEKSEFRYSLWRSAYRKSVSYFIAEANLLLWPPRSADRSNCRLLVKQYPKKTHWPPTIINAMTSERVWN